MALNTVVDLSWRADGACRGLDPSLFFPVEDEEAEMAKLICAGCPVQGRCLDHALGYREHDGVWGGATERERRRLLRQRRRARAAARQAAMP